MTTGPARQRGASAILIAATLLVLMGFAAIAIDGGLGMSERRQAQTAADFASLAALQFANDCPGNCTTAAAANAGASEAIAVVAENLDNPPTGWATCADPARPAAYTVVSGLSPCVSFTNNFDQARVVLPRVNVDTTFARAIGFANFGVSATAEATQEISATSEVIPFTASGPGLACLFNNQLPQNTPPCSGPSTGNFGYLDIALYGNDQLGTPSTCSTGQAAARVAVNTALGTDHSLWEYGTGSGQSNAIVDDHDACPIRSAPVTQLRTQTGTQSIATSLGEGLLTGISSPVSAPGRMTCLGGGNPCANVRGFSVDDTPIWDFLTDPQCGGVFSDIDANGVVNTRDEMTSCINTWTGGQLFDDTIADHPRFGAVPVLNSNQPPATRVNAGVITGFLPVFFETIYMDCNALLCDTVFSPGEAGSGNAACPNPLTPAVLKCGLTDTSGPDRVEAVTAFVIRVDMLSAEIQEFFPGKPGVIDFSLLE
jgi:Flp pilus assembly protein TadG